MAIDYAALKTYLTTDPDNLGLAQYLSVGNDVAVVNLVNGTSTTQVANLVPWSVLTAAIDATELPSLSDATLQSLSLRFQLIGTRDAYDLTNTALWTVIQSYFNTGSTPKTYVNLQTLQHRFGSHAEVTVGIGQNITIDDVALALGRGK